MQKRPSRTGRARSAGHYQPRYAPVTLDPAFPCELTHHDLPDAPIAHLHVHDALEFGYCHAGDGVFVVEDKVLPFGPGCATVISERELHLAQSARGTVSRWSFVYLDPARLISGLGDLEVLDTAALAGRAFPNVLDPAREPRLCTLIATLVDELERPAAGWASAVRGLVLAIMASLQRLPGRAVGDGDSRAAALARIAPALGCIAGRYREPLAIPALARACGMSGTHFRRRFAAITGYSPKEYLIRHRVQRAAAQLRSQPGSVLETALACGFGSLSAFNRHFRAVTGVVPRAWRRGVSPPASPPDPPGSAADARPGRPRR